MGVCWSSPFRLYGKMNCFFVDPFSHVSTLKSKKKVVKCLFFEGGGCKGKAQDGNTLHISFYKR